MKQKARFGGAAFAAMLFATAIGSSMLDATPVGATPLVAPDANEVQSGTLLLALAGLRPVDRFNIVQFNSTSSALFGASVEASVCRISMPVSR